MEVTEYLNPIAELDEVDSGKLISPSNAYLIRNGKRFFCPDYDCKDPNRVLIVAVSGKGNKFFRHKGNYKHDIRPETLLHKSAIKWFIERSEYEIPAAKIGDVQIARQVVMLDNNKTFCEFRRLQTIIPDVKLSTLSGFEFAIEIVVTHDLDDPKKKLIGQFGLPVLRVDLSAFYKKHPNECRTDLEFINEKLPGLMTNFTLKSWVIPPTFEIVQEKLTISPVEIAIPAKSAVRPEVGCMVVILTFGIVYFFLRD